jgi:hypothetical protein
LTLPQIKFSYLSTPTTTTFNSNSLSNFKESNTTTNTTSNTPSLTSQPQQSQSTSNSVCGNIINLNNATANNVFRHQNTSDLAFSNNIRKQWCPIKIASYDR